MSDNRVDVTDEVRAAYQRRQRGTIEFTWRVTGTPWLWRTGEMSFPDEPGTITVTARRPNGQVYSVPITRRERVIHLDVIPLEGEDVSFTWTSTETDA